MDMAWLLAIAAFYGGCGLAIRFMAYLQSED